MSDQSRRKFLKTASIGAVGALTVGSAMTGTAAAYGKDLRHEIGNLMVNGNYEEAEALLEKEGIEYSSQKQTTLYDGDADILNDNGEIIATKEDEFTPEDENTSGSDGGSEPTVSPDTYLPPGSGSSTSSNVLISDLGNDVYDVYYGWSLDKRSYWDDTSNQYNGCGSDAAAIFWPTEYFNTPAIGRDNFFTYGDTAVSYDQWEPRGGVSARVNDPNPNTSAPETFSDGFSTQVTVAQSGAANQNLVGQYEHTWVGALTPCEGVNVGITLGVFTLSTSDTPYTWSMPAQNYIP